MEKYAVDIDKVLDDFEEVEARKGNEDCELDAHLMEQSALLCHGESSTAACDLAQSEEQLEKNADLCNVTSIHEDNLSVYHSESKSNPSACNESSNGELSLNTLSHNTYSGENEIKFQQCSDNQNPEHQKHEVFCKENEFLTITNMGEATASLDLNGDVSKSCSGAEMHCSKDKPVALLEGSDFGTEQAKESHIDKSNTFCNPGEYEVIAEKNFVIGPDFFESSKDRTISISLSSKDRSQLGELLFKVTHVDMPEDSVNENGLSESAIENKGGIVGFSGSNAVACISDGRKSIDVKVNAEQSCKININLHDVSNSASHLPDKEVCVPELPSQPLIGSEAESAAATNGEVEINQVDVDLLPENAEGDNGRESSSSSSPSPPPFPQPVDFNQQEAYEDISSWEEDSGVSSQEDSGSSPSEDSPPGGNSPSAGNSPPRGNSPRASNSPSSGNNSPSCGNSLPNSPRGSPPHENNPHVSSDEEISLEDLDANLARLNFALMQDINRNIAELEGASNVEKPETDSSNPSEVVLDNNGNDMEMQLVDIVGNTVDSICSTEVHSVGDSSDAFTGARPKVDAINKSRVYFDCNHDSKLETEGSSTNSSEASVPNVSEPSQKSVALCENDCEFKSSEMSSGELCDNSDSCKDVVSNSDVDTVCEDANPVLPVEETCSSSCDNEIVSENAEEVGVEVNDCSEISDSKHDGSAPRLQRPTTLDLPSRHITAPEVSTEECSSVAENVNQPLNELNMNETVDESKGAESVTSVKPQLQIGIVKPFWIPDSDAPNCMHCGVKFTVIKRRHHCRACGKVLCSRCCNLRARLAYLNKEDRICQLCHEILSTSRIEKVPASIIDSQSSSSCGSSPSFSPTPQAPSSNFGDKNMWRPHPNNPDDYCSTVPPLQQIQISGHRPPPTVMVPIGVLKRGNKPRREPKQVIFSDGIRPGGDLTDLTESAEVPVFRRLGRKRVDKASSGDSVIAAGAASIHQKKQKRVLISDGEGPLPPILLQVDNAGDEKLDWNQIIEKMQDVEQSSVDFALLKNMHIFVKLIKLECCFGKECWCFTSHGLCTVGQDEVMVILERMPDEKVLPRGIFKLFTQIYDSASKGSTFDDLGHIIFPEQILGSSDHRGFLFVRPTFQCLSKLLVPNTPFLVAILIHKWEVPWAKVFPLRLMLRMGAECRYYPCSLVSVRYRKPVYFEIGQTIMSVLADLRNYQFTIPVIPGLVVHMEEKKTCVNIPRNRYEKVMKVLNSNNVEHVLALGSNFSTEADSHLVCMQREEGDYQTQAINIENTARRVTGASFIVFSGALKSSSGLSAKFSIVEDGLLVQIPQETMVALHMAFRDMRDLTIECGQINAAEPEEVVTVQWTRDDKKFNIGVRSPIDGRSLEGIPNLRIHTSTDYAGENYLIRWTEVFFLEVDENGSNVQNEMVDPCRLAETITQSCCMALTPYLDQLADADLTKIGLRVTLDSERDRVEYDIGSRGKPLPAAYMNSLDSGLIPVILRLSGSTQSEAVAFELIFHILIK